MLKDVRFMGVKDAIKLAPSSDTVIISILNQFEECNRPEHLHQFRDHLILHFVDTFEKPGEPEWQDQMSEEEHKVICKYDEEKAPNSSTRGALLSLSAGTTKRPMRYGWSCTAKGASADLQPWPNGWRGLRSPATSTWRWHSRIGRGKSPCAALALESF